MDGRKDSFFKWENLRKILGYSALGLTLASVPRDASANAGKNDVVPGPNGDPDVALIQNGNFASDKNPLSENKPNTTEQTTGTDPVGQEIALVTANPDQKLIAIRTPAENSLELQAILGKLNVSPDAKVNRVTWSDSSVNMGDILLLEISEGGIPRYVIFDPKKPDSTIPVFASANEAIYTLFKTKITNLSPQATLRTGPGIENQKATVQRDGLTWTGESQPDATKAGRVWYQLRDPQGTIVWVATDGISNGVPVFSVDTDLSLKANEVADLPNSYPKLDSGIPLLVPITKAEAIPDTQNVLRKYPKLFEPLSDESLLDGTGIDAWNNGESSDILHLSLIGCVSQDIPTAWHPAFYCTAEAKANGGNWIFLFRMLEIGDFNIKTVDKKTGEVISNLMTDAGKLKLEMQSWAPGTQFALDYTVPVSISATADSNYKIIRSDVKDQMMSSFKPIDYASDSRIQNTPYTTPADQWTGTQVANGIIVYK